VAATRSIELRTSVPGPKSEAILARKQAAIAGPLGALFPIVAAEARGATITDVDGNTFLDFTGGVGCLNVGHSHPRVVAAAHEQLDRFSHPDFTIVPYELYVELAERLLERTPISGPKKAAFFNSGAEAVENAVKIARQATGRQAVIAFEGAFHGRTLMAMSLTSKQHPYKAGMGPFAPEVYRAPFPNPYRWPGPDPAGEALELLRRMLTTHVAAENVAAIVFEPVQGEGGFVVPPVEWVRGLRELASEHGIVLVADEVQSGFGRTGKLFAIEHFGIEPDLIVVAKSIAAGVPLSGVLGRADVVDAAPDSSIGGTFVGSPLGCVAALAVLEELEGGLLDRGVAIGERIRGRFEELKAQFDQIGDVRGLGPMLAMEFVRSRDTKEPAPEIAAAVRERALQSGLILLQAGVHSNCIRVLVSLVASDEQLDEALDILAAAVAATCGERPLAAGPAR
jgi:4-aminobutyrate aminotransferase/(S)-3-amino-2-methylpropionate transaminase